MTHGHTHPKKISKSIHSAPMIMIYWLFSLPRWRETEKTRIYMQLVRTSTARTNSTCKTRLVRIKHSSQRNASPVSHGGYIFFSRFDCSTRDYFNCFKMMKRTMIEFLGYVVRVNKNSMQQNLFKQLKNY